MYECPTLNSNFERTLIHMDFLFSRQYLELLPGRLNYKGPEVLIEFIVSNTNMTTARGQSMSFYPNLIALYPDSIQMNYIKIWIKFCYSSFFQLILNFIQIFLTKLTFIQILSKLYQSRQNLDNRT
jgi:hypothetical protein